MNAFAKSQGIRRDGNSHVLAFQQCLVGDLAGGRLHIGVAIALSETSVLHELEEIGLGFRERGGVQERVQEGARAKIVGTTITLQNSLAPVPLRAETTVERHGNGAATCTTILRQKDSIVAHAVSHCRLIRSDSARERQK